MKVKYKLKYFTLIILLVLVIPLYQTNNTVINKKIVNAKNVLVDDQYMYYESTYDYGSEIPASDTSTYVDEEVNGHHIIIEDDAGLLTKEEEEKLYNEMKKTTEYGHVIFKTINHNPETYTGTYAQNYYHQKFANGVSGTLLLIDMDKRTIYIFSDGAIYETITNNKALTITDNIYRYASRGEYYECANKAFSQINTLLNGGKINEPMRLITSGILSLVIAALLGFVLSLYKARLKDPNPKDIVKLLNKKVEVIGEITGQKIGQIRRYNPPSSSSSGGSHSSGGGGGGGSHSSGGGGGHRF